MPTISVFFGIFIRMYYKDHGSPHFHAHYGEDMAVIEIETLKIRAGRIPPRALSLVLEWAAGHRDELLENWALAAAHKPLNRIAPLE